MNKMVITLPIAPYKNFSIGKLSTPILAEALAKKIDGKFYLAVNLLDSYKERNIDGYKELLDMYGITLDEFWIDKEHINDLLDSIYFLIQNGYIYKIKKDMLLCNCKKVEIAKDNISSINMIDSCFQIIDGEYYCKSCKKRCYIYEKEVLVLDARAVYKENMLFFPDFINKDVKTFHNNIGINQVVISRERNTGINVIYNNKKYNIDIDFLWEIYLSLFSKSDKIVLCSNHQLFQLYMVLMLENCFNKESKTIGLATPYINVENFGIEKELENRMLSLKLFTLFNFKWSKKENSIDIGLLKYLNSMNVEKKQQLYHLTIKENANNSIENIKDILIKDFNFQYANAELKRRRKNV